jgi:alkylation response protein AidB-like acyl-CoA dehydrogenase
MMFEAMLAEEQRALRDEARDLVRGVPRQLILDMDADRVAYPREFAREAGRRNLLGLRLPVAYGGRALRWEDEIVAIEEVGVLGTALACAYVMPSIVGEALDAFGTSKQKERWLVPLLTGERVAAEADFFLVYARTNPEALPHRGISASIVERGKGVAVEYLYGLLGTRGAGTGRLVFRDARVPAENLIGRENGAVGIFYRMMIPDRMTSATGAIGMGRAALEVAARYSDKRHAFGKRIRRFEGVSFKVADSIALLDAARGLVYGAARSVDAGDDPGRSRRLVSEAKKFATDAAWDVVNHAMQMLGGIGYTDVYPIERLLRDTRLIMIWTGTNEVMNLIIQHEHYQEVLDRRADVRDMESDAPEAGQVEEKVYE